jgi:hypothetical protein
MHKCKLFLGNRQILTNGSVLLQLFINDFAFSPLNQKLWKDVTHIINDGTTIFYDVEQSNGSAKQINKMNACSTLQRI